MKFFIWEYIKGMTILLIEANIGWLLKTNINIWLFLTIFFFLSNIGPIDTVQLDLKGTLHVDWSIFFEFPT